MPSGVRRRGTPRNGAIRIGGTMVALAMVAAACGGGVDDPEDPQDLRGGSIVLAAEQWAECLNVITTCFQSAWMHWTTAQYVLPKAMMLDSEGRYVASPLLVEAPTPENGGLQVDPFTITFRINPDAVWDDETPITSADFEFTWRAYLETTGSMLTVGYDAIESIDTTDPSTAVIQFREPYADWPDLFGGDAAYVLKADAFDGPDLEGEMLEEIPFSGGPWKLQRWSEQEAVLVRNDAYWVEEAIPLLDQAVFVPRTDTDSQITALLSREAVAAFPQPAPLITERLQRPGVSYRVGGGTIYEGLWFNHSAPPLDERAVRLALGHAIDREAILDALIRPDFPDAEVLNCAGWVPTVGEWCDNTQFADLVYNPARARDVLTDAGWTIGDDDIFEKDGERLRIGIATTSGNKAREDIQQLAIQGAREAGIEIFADNDDPPTLFGTRLPTLDFQVALFADVVSPLPSVTSLYSCDEIPSEENEFGMNVSAWCSEEADELMRESDRTVDPAERLEMIHRIGALVREDVVWLPLHQKPLLFTWRDDMIGGPVGEFAVSPYTGFWNMNRWYLR